MWLLGVGAMVAKPLVEHSDYDLIADFGERLLRVQVKTSTCFRRNRYDVALCTRGGNRSWNGIVKRLDPSRCDALFVHVGDGRRWFIPASEIGGGVSILLGGPRYATFEIEPGPQLKSRLASTY